MSSPGTTDRPRVRVPDSGPAPKADPPPNGVAVARGAHATVRYEAALRRAAYTATIGIAVILFGAFLQAGRPFLLPVASAIVIGIMVSPLARLAARYRVPPVVFALLAVVVFIVLIQIAFAAVAAPLLTLQAHASDIGDNIRQKLGVLDPLLASLRDLQNMLAPDAGDDGLTGALKLDLTSIAQAVIGFLTPAVGEVVVFLATLFLYLVSRDELRRHVILMASGSDARLRAIRVFNEVEGKLVQYIGTMAAINLVVGALTALGTYLLGYPQPALLGVLEFLCAFVPYLGAAFMAVVLFCVGLISFPSWHEPLLAVALFIAMVTCEGQFITPNIVGARFTTNPLAIFLALVFWTWLWGPVGTFLSVPFLLIGLAILNHYFAENEAGLPS
jgi:predicted PurR-regulated permease PerM